MAATINGLVFDDLNNNGVHDLGEPGIAGAEVVLQQPDGTCLRTTTDANGIYSFGNLNLVGNYTVYETAITTTGCPPTELGQPAGYTVSTTLRVETINVTSSDISGNVAITSMDFGHTTTASFLCEGVGYQVAGLNSTEFAEINLVTGESTVISDLGFQVNALGYNTTDNFLYAIRNDITPRELIRINPDGTTTSLGSIPNLPNGSYNVGTFDENGHYFIYNNGTNRYYVVDLNPSSPTYGQLVDPTAGYVLDTSPYGTPINALDLVDWAYSPITGQLYGVNPNNGNVQCIDPTTGQVTGLNTTGVPSTLYGAVFMDANGVLYAIRNDNGRVIRITLTDTTATGEPFSQSLASTNNDGASCIGAAINVDYGDAPDISSGNGAGDYSTLLANDGPRHQIIEGLTLGTQITGEADALQNADATGDDIPQGIQDDGVTAPVTVDVTQATYTLPVKVTNETGSVANVYGWIDFNMDGIFQTNESATATVQSAPGEQTVDLVFTIPQGTQLGETFTRVRLTTDTLVNTGGTNEEDTRSLGPASDGEVEDYQTILTDQPLTAFTVTKSVDKTEAQTGDILTYTVSVTNDGSATQNNVVFTDPIPAGTTFVAGSLSVDKPFTGTNPETGVTITSLAPGETAVVTWQVQIGNTLPDPNPIPNTATVTAEDGTTATSNTVTTNVTQPPTVITATKSVDKTEAQPGDVITYTVNVTNNGTTTQNNVVFTDPIPAGTTFVAGSLNVDKPFTGTNPATGVTITSLAPGETAVVTWQVQIGNTIPDPNPIPNTATVTAEDGTTSTSNTVTTNVTQPPTNITATKSVDKTEAQPGDVITYTVNVTNNGTTTQNNVVFTDPIPAGTTFVAGSLNVDKPFTGTNPATGVTITSLAPGETAVVTWQVQIGNAIPNPNPIPNTATVTAEDGTTSTSNTVNTNVTAPTVITATKSVDKTEAQPGDIITYTVNVTNNGTITQNNVVFTDPIPAGTTFVAGSLSVDKPFTGTNPETGITITSLAPGETAVVTWQVQIGNTIPNPNPIPNTATVTAEDGTTSTSNTVNTNVTEANIESQKSVDKAFAKPGDTIRYTVTLTNTGTAPANNVLFTDQLPNGTTYANNLSVDAAYTGTDPMSGLTITTINPGQTVTISWDVTIGDTIPNPNPIQNVGIVTVPGEPSEPTNPVTTDVKEADLTSPGNFVKSVDKTLAQVGDVLTYTITTTNTGNTDANNVVITDLIPNGTALVPGSVTASVPFTSGAPDVTVNLTNPIAPNETVTVTFKVTVTELPNPNPIPNTASVNYTYTVDPNNPNSETDGGNTNTVTTAVEDVIIVSNKTVSDAYADLGDTITYTVTLTNPTTQPINNVLFTDQLPSGTTYANNLSVSAPYTGTDPMSGLTITTVNPGQTVTIKWDIRIGNVLPNPNPIQNIGIVTPPGKTPEPTNPVTTQVNNADLTSPGNFVKSVDKDNAQIGDILTYTINVTNTGNTNANNVVITDSIPNGTSFVNGSITANVPFTTALPNVNVKLTNPITPGETVTLSFKVLVDEIPNPNPIPNTANVDYTYTVDPNNPNGASNSGNTNTVTTVVNQAIISPENAVKSADRTVTTPGDVVTYTVSLTNTGNIDATNVIVNDVIPQGTQFVPQSVTIDGMSKPNENPNVGINVGTIGPNETVLVTFKVLVLDGAPNPLENTANVMYSYTPDPTKPPVTKEVTTNEVVIPVVTPVVEMTKVANRDKAIVGDLVTYTVTVTNNNPITINNVVVTDLLNQYLQYENNLKINGSASNQDITEGVNIGSMISGQTVTITFDARVIALPPNGELINTSKANFTYMIAGQQFNGSGEASEEVEVLNANIVATKETSADPIIVGKEFVYTISYTNAGNIDAENMFFKDPLPSVFEVLQVKVDGAVVNGDPNVGFDIGSLAVGETKVVELTIVANGEVPNDMFTNVATVDATFRPDPNQPPSTITIPAEVTTPVVNPKLDIVKTSSVKYAEVGDVVTYTVTATNNGNITLNNIVLSDSLDDKLEFVEGSVRVNSEPRPDESIISGINVGTLDVGESVTITFEAIALEEGVTTNVVNGVFTYRPDPNKPEVIGTSNSNENELIVLLAQIEINKTANKDFVVLGDTIEYTVTVRNTGQLDAFNVIFTDELPRYLELIPGSFTVDGKVINSVDLNNGVNIGDIPVGGMVVVKYSVKVISNACNSRITNEAIVNFLYELPDGTVGSGEASSSMNVIDMGIANFKQFSLEEYLNLPAQKPNIEDINNIEGKIELIKCHVIKTEKKSSLEGQILSGYKLIVHGVLKIVVQYTACIETQSVHSAHYDIPFSTFVILPIDYEPGSKLEVEGEIEDIYNKVVDCRTFFTNTTALINVKILFC